MNLKLRQSERDHLQRLEGHADALLGRVIGLHIQIGLVDPLLEDDEPLLPPPDHRRFSGGLTALRESVVRSCVLDFVGGVADSHRNAPNLKRVAGDLEDKGTVSVLRKAAELTAIYGAADFQEDEALMSRERATSIERFEYQLSEFRTAWESFHARPLRKQLKRVRDKVIAHREIQPREGYRFVSPPGLLVSWAEFKQEARLLGELCELVGLVVLRVHYHFGHEWEEFLREGQHLWEGLQVVPARRPEDPSLGS